MQALVSGVSAFEVEGVVALSARRGLEGKLFLEGKVPGEDVLDNFLKNYKEKIEAGNRVIKVDKKYKLRSEDQEEPIVLTYNGGEVLVSRAEANLSFPCENPEKLQKVIIQLLRDQHFEEREENSGIFEWKGENMHHRSLRIRTIGSFDEERRKLKYTLVSKGKRNSFPELHSEGLTYTLENELSTESIQGKAIFQLFLQEILKCRRHNKKDKFKKISNFNLDFNGTLLPLEYIEFAGNYLLEAEHILPFSSELSSIKEALSHINDFYNSVGLTPYLIKSGKASDLRYED